jgi:hypothetical protein
MNCYCRIYQYRIIRKEGCYVGEVKYEGIIDKNDKCNHCKINQDIMNKYR